MNWARIDFISLYLLAKKVGVAYFQNKLKHSHMAEKTRDSLFKNRTV